MILFYAFSSVRITNISGKLNPYFSIIFEMMGVQSLYINALNSFAMSGIGD